VGNHRLPLAAAGSAVEPVGTSFDDVIMIESQTAGYSSSPSDSSSSSSSGSGTSSSSSSDSGIVSVVASPVVAGPAPVGYVLDEDGSGARRPPTSTSVCSSGGAG